MIQITGGQMPLSGGTLTGPLAIAVGSAAAPGLAVAGDANTGLWAPAADTLAVSTAGVERLRVTSTGILDVTGAAEFLGVTIKGQGASTSNPLYFADTGGTEWYLQYQSNGLGFSENAVADGRLFLKDGGNVGIGTISPTAALHVPASTTARASLRIPDGTAPTAPNAGDVWAAGGKLYYYNGATTKEIAFV